MTLKEWAVAILRAGAFTLGMWGVLWLLSGHDHHPSANWGIVCGAYLIGFWSGHTSKKGSSS